jgi:hypothetical protein
MTHEKQTTVRTSGCDERKGELAAAVAFTTCMQEPGMYLS